MKHFNRWDIENDSTGYRKRHYQKGYCSSIIQFHTRPPDMDLQACST